MPELEVTTYPVAPATLEEACPFDDEEGTIWSFSRLEKYQVCPRAYWLLYEKQPPVKEIETKSALEGRIVHEVIRGILTGKGDPEVLAKRLASGTWLLDEDDVEEIVDMAKGFAERFATAGDVYSEWYFEGELEGIRFHGYVDLIEVMEHGVRVTDFKSGRDKWKPSEKMQLPLYAAVAAAHFRKPVAVRNWFVRLRKNPTVEEEATPALLTKAVDWLKETVRAVEESRSAGEAGFPVKPGGHCDSCGVALACAGFAQEEPLTSGQAARIGAAVLRLEAARSVALELLRPWVEKNGPVKVGNEYFGHYVSECVRVDDVARFVKLLEESGTPPWRYLSVLGSKLKPDLPNLKDVVKDVVVQYKRTVFTHKKDMPNGDAH
ncbi:MAG: RecB family exonuclease [Anaerolineae bacterium]